MDINSKPIKLKRPVYFVGEGYYHVVDTKQAVFGNFHHFGYIEHVVMSYVEQTEVTAPLVILQETRYPYDNYIEKLDEMLSSYKIDSTNAFFYIFTEQEPRPATYSFWVPYLLQKFKVPANNIVYMNSVKCELDSDLPINVVSNPLLGIKFASNHTDIASYRAEHEINMFSTKNKLFSNLVRRLNISRVLTTAALMKNFNKDQYVLSCGEDDIVKFGSSHENFYNRIAASVGHDLNFMSKLPIRFDSKLDVTVSSGHQFKMTDRSLQTCLFEVVHETVGAQDIFMEQSVMTADNFFCVTEKSFRHAFNLQIPIFMSRAGFYKWFYETFGLRPYKSIPWQEWDEMQDYHTKVNSVVKFLKSINKQDYQKIFDENKDIIHHNVIKLRNHAIVHHFYALEVAQTAAGIHWDTKSLNTTLGNYLSKIGSDLKTFIQSAPI